MKLFKHIKEFFIGTEVPPTYQQNENTHIITPGGIEYNLFIRVVRSVWFWIIKHRVAIISTLVSIVAGGIFSWWLTK